ncbi:hypothetical protein T03_1740 [Trichinella britovi]|uniref:Globin family profile domain-containing protein n=1 Tax=Trichinella britovi TaxID=45882 RepID=A0A0V1D4E2_TRIBR|nr:hypothetical protein T03_1740 [Trichinella britovi]
MGNRQPSNGRPAVPVETDVVVDTILPDDLQLLADPNTKRLLQMTWPADFADLYELGLEICQELFKQMAPALVSRHRLSMDDVVTAEEQSLGVRLRTEALRFVQVLHLALINCDDLRNLKNHLNKIGKIYLLRGLDGSHPQLFKYSVVRTMEKRLRNKFDLDDASKQKVLKAWETIADFICMQWSYKEKPCDRRNKACKQKICSAKLGKSKPTEWTVQQSFINKRLKRQPKLKSIKKKKNEDTKNKTEQNNS